MTGAAERDDALRADRRARRLAQQEFDRPLLLEAGAGTGKTTTLVARILAWCLGAGWRRHEAALIERERERGRGGAAAADAVAADAVAAAVLERVVAITFTEDAAAEMAQRVARELALLTDAAAPAPPWLVLEELAAAERARRAAALLAGLDRLVVRTIHAFCRGLLADHPLEARLHPELSVDADGLLLEEVARETVETNLRRFYGRDPGAAGDDPYLRLAARGIGPRELVEALIALSQAGLPADALDADPLSPARVAGLRRRLLAACRAVDELVAPRRGRFGGRMQKAPGVADGVAAAARYLAASEDGLADLATRLCELLPEDLCNHLGKWQKWRVGKAERRRWTTCATSWAPAPASCAP